MTTQLLAAFAIAILGAALGVILTLRVIRAAFERALILAWRWTTCETPGCGAKHLEVAYALPLVPKAMIVRMNAHPSLTPKPNDLAGPLRTVLPALSRARAALHLLGHAADAQMLRDVAERVDAASLALEAVDALHAKGEHCACPDCVADVPPEERHAAWRARPSTEGHRFCGCGWCRGDAPKPLTHESVLYGDHAATSQELGLDPSSDRTGGPEGWTR